ncbi:MAG: membrane protein insertion efficiency factor YidD [Oscillospiraceae bacterium]|nr:membrane protein insertion efficiency factor YidD [Oscillospiraceae bacterium]
MKRILLKLILFYKKNISPNKPVCCRFYPTCSSYAYEAINRFGAVKGSYLSLKRLLRCHPLCKGGYDPVPERLGKKGK